MNARTTTETSGHRRRRVINATALAASTAAVLVGGLLSGCSSGSTGGGSAGAAPGVTAKSITVGVVEDQTGAFAQTARLYNQAFQATVKAVNAQGGVDGRQIKLVYEDAASTTTGNLSAAESLIQNKGAFMVVELSAGAAGAAPYLTSHGIPVVSTASSSVVSTSPNFFTADGGFNPNPNLTSKTFGEAFKVLGVNKVGALAIATSSLSISSAKAAVAAAPLAGIQKGYINTSVQNGTTDWTPYILGFKSSNTDGMFCIIQATDCLHFFTAAKQQGLNIKMLATSLYSDALLLGPSGSAMEGVVVGVQFVPTQYDTPATVAMTKTLSQQGITHTPDFFDIWGYATAKLLQTGLENAGSHLTRSGFINNLRKVTDWTAAGLAPQGVNFAKEMSDPPIGGLGAGNCWWLLEVQGGKFVPVQPQKPLCSPGVPIR